MQNGETCLHAATISGNPELVQLLLEKSRTDDALLTNASGQNPLDLLIMFINYGNISLTSNLLKVRVLAFVRFHPLKAMYCTVEVHNLDLQEKTTSTLK